MFTKYVCAFLGLITVIIIIVDPALKCGDYGLVSLRDWLSLGMAERIVWFGQ